MQIHHFGDRIIEMKIFHGISVLGMWFWISLPFFGCSCSANLVLIGKNVTLSFDAVEATFGPSVKASGVCGTLYVAEPIDACSPLTKVEPLLNMSLPFALIFRGGCTFEEKVRRAQKAGYKAAIVFDNETDAPLVAMSGRSSGIKIHAVFISKDSGELLKKYASSSDVEIWIIPSVENSAWSIMAISFISLLAMSAVLATCFFVRRHRIRRQRPRAPRVREFHGMSSRLVKAMPSLIFTAVLEDNCTSRTCAICLEDYNVGEKLRILPCQHKFHAFCVDLWLTSWRTFCPVCKRDARVSTGEPTASECTPLLSTSPASVVSSSVLSSARSLASSAVIQIASSSRLLSASRTPHSNTYLQHSSRSYRQSPSLSVPRSSFDLRNSSSQRSQASHLISSHSLGYPSASPLDSRYASYMPSPSNASASYLGSSYQIQPLHVSESAASFSPYASAHSLPECS